MEGHMSISAFGLAAPFAGVIILPTQTMHYQEEIPQSSHTFALFDSSQMGNLMVPVLER